jgi:hypothetical protein
MTAATIMYIHKEFFVPHMGQKGVFVPNMGQQHTQQNLNIQAYRQ